MDGMTFFTYDLETFPNYFSFAGKFYQDPKEYYYEVSDRTNDRLALLELLSFFRTYQGLHMVGYNSLGFDYPIIHELIENPYKFTSLSAYNQAQSIISSNDYGRELIYAKDRFIPQIDLAKVHHFDNINRRTPLKSLECAMRSPHVIDLPIAPGTILTPEQMDQFKIYNMNDVTETERFFERSKDKLQMRHELLQNGTLRGDVYNYSDVKIGSELLVSRIGRTKCYEGRKPKQTRRTHVTFKDIILPTVAFGTEPFNDVLDHFKNTVFQVLAKERPSYSRRLAGLDFHFGIGGVHASVESRAFRSSETMVIRDVDVASMYPSIAVANGFYPQHLGQDFVRAYAQVIQDRKQYPKTSSMNRSLKLAGNGVFGLSDAFFSCFYDPRFPKQITVNGQLQLCMLVESLMHLPQCTMIQANTDGVTIRYPREFDWLFHLLCGEWEKVTKLKLEHVEYQAMWIRDVNNYIAQGIDGKIKRKGAYWFPEKSEDYDEVWNKDFSSLAVQKAADAAMVKGINPLAALYINTDPFDFMLRYRATGDSQLMIDDRQVQKTTRYFVAKEGGKLTKFTPLKPHEKGRYKRKPGISDKLYKEVMDELSAWNQGGQWVDVPWDARINTKSKERYADRVTEIQKGFKVQECNDASRFDWANLDYTYYLNEVEKLIIKE